MTEPDATQIPSEPEVPKPRRTRRSRRRREPTPVWQCVVTGCTEPHVLHRLCHTHYRQRASARQNKEA